MPLPPFPEDVRELLRRPNAAVVGTLRSDGAPVTVATWYLLEDDDRILLNMDHSRVRVAHLQRDPRIALTVLTDDWYDHVSVVGRVDALVEDPDLRDIDRLALHFTARPFRNRTSPRVSAWVVAEKWHAWGSGRT